MENSDLKPALTRYSIMMAVIALTLGVIYILPDSGRESFTSFLGIIVNFKPDLFSLVILIISLLTLSGTLWVFEKHPMAIQGQLKIWRSMPNALIPVLSVLVISLTMREMNRSVYWWIVYGLGIFIISIIVLAEYYVISPNIEKHPIASVGLIGLTHGVFLLLAIVLRTSDMRLYIVTPILLFAGAFVSFRMIYLRMNGKVKYEYILLIALMVGQFGIALYYLFLTSIQFAVLITGLLYAISSLAVILQQKTSNRLQIFEPVAMVLFSIVLTVITALV